jgi:hypothetical protein
MDGWMFAAAVGAIEVRRRRRAEQDRAAAAAKTWLLAQIGKKRSTSSDIADTAPKPFARERLAA